MWLKIATHQSGRRLQDREPKEGEMKENENEWKWLKEVLEEGWWRRGEEQRRADLREESEALTPSVLWNVAAPIFSSLLRRLISICLNDDNCKVIVPEFSHFYSFLECLLQTQTVSSSSVILINLINPVWKIRLHLLCNEACKPSSLQWTLGDTVYIFQINSFIYQDNLGYQNICIIFVSICICSIQRL